jgi:methylglutaconyl-CoA hydratase
VKNDELEIMTNQVVAQLLKGGPVSQAKFKEYIRDMDSIESTDVISKIRSSEEGQEGLSAFLEKRKPNWIKN